MSHPVLVAARRLGLACAWSCAAASALAGCAGSRAATYPTLEDRVTPGIFLDPGEELPGSRGSARKIYPAGLELTKASEGWVPRLYHDAAQYCTIGYGHLVKKARCDGSEPEEFRAGLTEPRGAELLAGDMERAELAVLASVEGELTDGQYAALCDFVYNVGAGNFSRSTLLRVIQARQYDSVPPQFRRWVKAGGKELPGLKARREREIELFFEGLGQPRGGAPAGENLEPIDVRTGE